MVEHRFDLKKRKRSMSFDGKAAGNCICHCRVDSDTESLQDPVYLSNSLGRFTQLANIEKLVFIDQILYGRIDICFDRVRPDQRKNCIARSFCGEMFPVVESVITPTA